MMTPMLIFHASLATHYLAIYFYLASYLVVSFIQEFNIFTQAASFSRVSRRVKYQLPEIMLACFFLLTGSSFAVAEQPAIDISRQVVSLIPDAVIIKDPENALTLDDVLSLDSSPLLSSRDNIVSFGFSDATHWIHIKLYNPAAYSITKLLVFEPTWLDELEVHIVTKNGATQSYHAGDTMAFGQRTVANHKINLELDIPSGASRLLIRTRTVDPYHVGITLTNRESFYRSENTETLHLGLLYGAIVAMILYNLILFLSTRERVYAAYISYLFFFLLMHATYNGYTFPLFWPNAPNWGNWAHSIFIYFFVASGLIFAINFLELKNKQPRSYKIAISFLSILFIFALLTPIGGYSLHVRSSIIWIIIYAPFVLILGIAALRAGNRSARFFLTAALFGFIGSFITALAVVGLIPYNYISYHAVDIGMLIDAILLSFALADRLRLARLQTEQVKSELLTATQEHALQLDQTVTQRTLDLSNANASKDRFFSIIAHDLRGPIGGLTSLFNEVIIRPEDFTADDLDMTRESISNTSQLLEQLLSWARSQRGEILVEPVIIDITELLTETQDLFSSLALNKGISLDMSLNEKHYVYADISMTRTILRNLTSNALKFTGKTGSVHATIKREDTHYIVSIMDDGVGIPDEVQATLFQLDSRTPTTSGTAGESGSGLGLVLCAEFVNRNHGEIGVVSTPGSGSRFWFSLPVAK